MLMIGKNKVILLDTNVIIRYLLGDDQELSKKANQILLPIEKGIKKGIILESIFTECVFILTKIYLVPKDKIHDSLSLLLQYKGIVNNDKQTLKAALELFTKSKLHIVDCILATKAKEFGYEIASFDQELIKTMKI